MRWNAPDGLERLERNLDRAGLEAGWVPGRRSVEDLPGLEAMVRRAGPDRAKRTRRIVRSLAKARRASTRAKA